MRYKNSGTPQEYQEVLQHILDTHQILTEKNLPQQGAFLCGARALEYLNENGANLRREYGIMIYHANNPGAHVLHDDNTRAAIKAAIKAIDRMIEREA